MNKFTNTLALAFSALFCLGAEGQSLSAILADIGELEGVRDPKCYATASRLEDFMYGTPIVGCSPSPENLLQKRLAEVVWRSAGRSGGEAALRISRPHSVRSSACAISERWERSRFPAEYELEITLLTCASMALSPIRCAPSSAAQQDAMINAGC